MKISVITVSYNSESTIEDSFKSLFAQTYDNIEYIIVDGLSRDRTISLIKKYEEKATTFPNIEFRWISEKDRGIYDAINKGINMATGDVIGIINSDDYYYDENVLTTISKVFKNKQIDCVYGNLIYVDSQNTKKVTRKWTSKPFEPGLFEKSWTPAHPTFYCRRRVYEDFGLYRTDFKIASDVELMYRLLENHQLKSEYINQKLVVMRQGGVSSSGLKSTITITREMKQAINENGGKFKLIRYLGYKALKAKEFVSK